MKSIMVLSLFFCATQLICMNELSEEHQVTVQGIEAACQTIINNIFTQARESLEAKEDIINSPWLARKEIKELQHCMSDALIELSFDAHVTNVIPERLEQYLQIKIREEAEKIFESNEVSSEGARQFFYLSKMMCGLSRVSDCHGMMRAIKNENSIPLLKLKIQEKVQRREKKEEMRQLCENIIMGALPRE